MNKIGIIIGVVALSLAGFLAVSLSTLQKNYDALALQIKDNTIQDSIREAAKPSLPDLTVNESNLPIAYVEREVLMDKYQYVNDITNELERKYNNVNNSMIKAEKDFMARVQDLQDQAQSGMIQEAEYKKKAQALGEEEQRLVQRKQKHTQDLTKREQELGVKLQAKITDYLKKYSSEFHYSYILTTGGMSNVLYASDSLNITDEIIDGLNSDYSKD